MPPNLDGTSYRVINRTHLERTLREAAYKQSGFQNMKERNPERGMFGRPGKIDRKAPQSYTEGVGNSMPEQQEQAPNKTVNTESIAEPRKIGKNLLTPEEARKMYEPRIKASKDPDEIQTLRLMMEERIPSITGAAIGTPPDSEEEERLRAAGWIDGGGVPPGGVPPTPPGGAAPGGDGKDKMGFSRERWTLEAKKAMLTERKVRDKVFNELFEVVDAKPHRFFQEAFDLYMQSDYNEFLKLILQGAKRDPLTEVPLSEKEAKELREDLGRYEREFQVREAAHNQNAILFLPSVKAEQLFDNMQNFESLLADVAFKTPGVMKMMDIYEEALREEMMKNGGYLKPEAITGTAEYENEPLKDKEGHILKDAKGNVRVATVFTSVEKGIVELRTKEKFKEFVKKYQLTARDKKGNLVVIHNDEPLQDWEIDRTFITARAMMIMTGRFLSVAAEGKLAEGLGKYHSLFLQDILQAYSPYVHLLGKYGITGKAIAAYLHQPDKKLNRILGILHTWNPKALGETYKRYKGNELSILEAADEFFYIQRQNPNKAGDVLTWQSWRFPLDEETPGSLKEFISRGREKMGERWDKTHKGALSYGSYEAFMAKEAYYIPRNATKEAAAEIKERIKNDWGKAHPGTPSLDEYEAFANEYVNWIGTALRFERMRSGLQHLKPGEKSDLLDEAKKILEQMVELQPHRLFTKSSFIQARIIKSMFGVADYKFLTDDQKMSLDRALENFNTMETALLRDRERLLDKGLLFKDVSLKNYFIEIIKDMDDREFARKFAEEFRSDFTKNEAEYLNEFIYRREYRHGFALWSGDVPWDELKLSALGPTGSFVRRARDNKYQMEAWGEEIKLLNALKDIQSPDDLLKHLREIYGKIELYSPDRAKEALADKIPGYAQFFAESGMTNIPVFGFLIRKFGKPSFAKLAFGEHAPAWTPTELRYLYHEAESKEIIEEGEGKKLAESSPGSSKDMFVDVGVTMAQLLALAFILYMMEKVAREK